MLPAWIEQLGKIDDNTVEGRCQNYDAVFMPMRRELSCVSTGMARGGQFLAIHDLIVSARRRGCRIGQVAGEAGDAPGAQRTPQPLSGPQTIPDARCPASGDTAAGPGHAAGLARLDGMTPQITRRPGPASRPLASAARHHSLAAFGAQPTGWLVVQAAAEQPVPAHGNEHAERVIAEQVHSVRPEVQ
ncbi:MAG: hypothetical protein ACRDRE_15730 [Pseudonocardiaceae bacterium]